MNACSAACGHCGRCSDGEGRSGVQFECCTCGEPVFVGLEEPYPGPQVECERCRRAERFAAEAERQQRAVPAERRSA